MRILKHVIDYAHEAELLVILDAKRNDIGSTAEAYASAYLGRQSVWSADALTINPSLGDDSLVPFVAAAVERDAGLFVLAKTSNPGGARLQDRKCDEKLLYEHTGMMIEGFARESLGECGYGAVGAVVGATFPQALAELRQQMPSTWFLVPGLGQQGARPDDVTAAFDDRGLGAIVNCSRSVIFAYDRPEYRESYGESKWQQAVEAAARDTIAELKRAINK